MACWPRADQRGLWPYDRPAGRPPRPRKLPARSCQKPRKSFSTSWSRWSDMWATTVEWTVASTQGRAGIDSLPIWPTSDSLPFTTHASSKVRRSYLHRNAVAHVFFESLLCLSGRPWSSGLCGSGPGGPEGPGGWRDAAEACWFPASFLIGSAKMDILQHEHGRDLAISESRGAPRAAGDCFGMVTQAARRTAALYGTPAAPSHERARKRKGKWLEGSSAEEGAAFSISTHDRHAGAGATPIGATATISNLTASFGRS